MEIKLETFNFGDKKKILLHLFRILLRILSSRSLTELVHNSDLPIILSVVTQCLILETDYRTQ